MTANDFPRCATCAHFEPIPMSCGFRKCKGGLTKKDSVEAVITAGWEGGCVDFYEVDMEFGCINHSEIKES